jgi:RNA polymerase sigma-70 factor, ECF subfamily
MNQMSTTHPRQAAFECADQAYSDFSIPIFTYAYWLVGNRERASELVQQAFLESFRTLLNTDTPRALYLSLLSIATRTVLAALDQGVCPAEQDSDQGAVTTLLQTAANPVQVALGSLPVRYRAVLLLTVQAKLSYDEIAQVLTHSPDGVMRDLAHARQAFRASYAEAIIPGTAHRG